MIGRLLVATAVVAALVAAAPAQAAERKVPRNFYGAIFAGHVEDAPVPIQDQVWDRMAEAGVESSRVMFNWQQIEAQQGRFDWSKPDRFVTNAAVRGISLMPTVMYAPTWAQQYPGTVQSPPKSMKTYAGFVGELVRRYGPKGSFWAANPGLPARPVRHWQIWNEPQLTDHWWRTRSWVPNEAKRFGQMLRESRRAVRKADPGGKIVLAGHTNQAWEDLAKLYHYGGVRGHFDIAAVHMFPGKWRNTAVIVERFRAALNRAGDRRVPIWVTEMTWPSAKGRASVPPWADSPYYRSFITSEKGTAERLEGAYTLLGRKSFRSKNRLERVLWFTAASIFQQDYIWNYSGLLEFTNDSVRTKPAYSAFQRIARRDQGCAKTTAGNCR